jgi:malate permease and related proteins
MHILETIVPVFLLIGLGVFLRKKELLTASGISSLKKLLINILLPVTAFNVLINGNITRESFLLIAIMIVILFAAWGIGHLYARFFDERIRGYVPLIMTTFEGGMIGWSLVSIIVGTQNLFLIIPMDVINGVFGFTFMATNLKILAGSKMTAKETANSIIKNPLIIAVILGFAGSAFHLGSRINNSIFSGTYNRCITYLTGPISPLMLICIGFGLTFNKKAFSLGIKVTALRYLTIGILASAALFILYRIHIPSPTLLVALLTYFSVPTSFLLQMYTDDKDVTEFTSSVLSLEILVSLLIFSILSVLVQTGFFGAVGA